MALKDSRLLAGRAQIDRMDAGLYGIGGMSYSSLPVPSYLSVCSLGAQEIIAAMTSRRTVTKLILSHNELGDEG